LSGGKIFHLTAHMLPLYLVKHNALFSLITLLRDLEMWADHSRSLKVVQFESFGTVFVFHSNYGRIGVSVAI